MDNNSFIERLAASTGLERDTAAGMASALGEVITAITAGGDSQAVPGFGTFATEKNDEYISVSSDTGQRVLYPPEIVLTFKSSVILRNKFK